MSRAPQTPSAERSAPAKFWLPSSTRAGPSRISLQRRFGADVDARAARQVGVWRRHAPVEALRGRLLGARERRADHHRVGTGGERLADVGADAHAAVRDDRDAHAATTHVLVASRGHVGGRRDLRHADTQDAARRAGGPGSDADEDARDAGLHQLERGLVVDAVADHDGDVAGANQLVERQLVVGARRMARGEHGALDDETSAPAF